MKQGTGIFAVGFCPPTAHVCTGEQARLDHKYEAKREKDGA